MDPVQDGDFVIVKRMYGDHMWILKVSKETTKVSVHSLVGTEFGSIIEWNKKSNQLVAVKLTKEEMYELSTIDSEALLVPNTGNASSAIEENDSRDNRNLLDDGKSQMLSMNEIESFKESDLSEKEIIASLVENSSTFKEKSLFSQAKYIKKKKEKYSSYFKIYKPNVRLLTEMYFTSCPKKISHLRVDSLAQMLNAANVRSGGKYIVIDNSLGLLSAAVTERLVGHLSSSCLKMGANFGSVIQVYLEQGPCSSWRSCVDVLNIPQFILSAVLKSLQIRQVYNVVHGIEEESKPERRRNQVWGDSSTSKTENGHDPEANQGEVGHDVKKRKLDERAKRREERKKEESEAKHILTEDKIDGALIICKSFLPSSIMDIVLGVLAPSAPFVVFCSNIEPLAECLISLKGRCVNLKIQETWLRKYQVLPGRTRPDMNMFLPGGYFLTGTTLLMSEACTTKPC